MKTNECYTLSSLCECYLFRWNIINRHHITKRNFIHWKPLKTIEIRYNDRYNEWRINKVQSEAWIELRLRFESHCKTKEKEDDETYFRTKVIKYLLESSLCMKIAYLPDMDFSNATTNSTSFRNQQQKYKIHIFSTSI